MANIVNNNNVTVITAESRIETVMRDAAKAKRGAKALRVAIEAFTGMRMMTKSTTNTVARIGRASVSRDEAKSFLAQNPAQAIDVLRSQALAAKREVMKNDWLEWVRNVALQSDIAATIEHCDAFLVLWKDSKQSLKAKAA